MVGGDGELATTYAHCINVNDPPLAMTFNVVNRSSGKQFQVEQNETVLQAALRHGRVFPYSCRDGACGSCKADLIQGRVDYGQVQAQVLTDEEKADGKVLLCQARPLEDLIIAVGEIAAAQNIEIKMMPCRVASMENLAHDVMALQLQLPQQQRLQFLAGQYIDILLRDGRRRSFSLANAPFQDNTLEIHIRLVPDGRFTNHVFSAMKERDILRLQGPLGTFFLREESQQPILMMAGGTGIAPVKSILEDAFVKGIKRPIHLFWGVRAKRDLYLDTMIDGWCARHPGLSYTPVLSEPQPDDWWSGAVGWVHQALIDAYPCLDEYEVYASGPPPMIEAGKSAFASHGLRADRLFYDSFEFSSDAQPR